MSTAGANVPAHSRGNRSRFLLLLLLELLAGGVFAAAIVYFSRESNDRPFPQLSEIQRMDATVSVPQSKDDVTFEVPQSHWEAILSAMLPARKDDHPALWVMPGDLKLKLKNGDPFYIAIYSTYDELGAFAAGPSFERRVYYRGGNSSALEKAVADALKASKAEHP
jgi:hypothetical protein